MGAQGFLRVRVRSLLFHRAEEREFAQESAAVFWRKSEVGMPRDFFASRAFGGARMEVHAFRRDRVRERHCFGDEVFEILAQTVEQHSNTLEAERRALGPCVEGLPAPLCQLLEADHTLLGTGFGLEFQAYNPAYLTVRADLGFALKDDDQSRGREVSVGDSRLHMSVTLAW